MRRRLWYLLAWAVATAVTVGMSWWGIRSVLVVATPSHVSPLSAVDLRRVAPDSPAPSTAQTTSVVPNQAAAVSPTTKPSPTAAETWAPVDKGNGATAYKRTFRTNGGEAVVVSAEGDVQVESSKPKQGFSVSVNRQSADSVMVTFSAPHKASRIWARWTNGPYVEIAEVAGVGP